MEVYLTKYCHPSTKIQSVLSQKIGNFGWRFLGNTVHFSYGALRRIRGAKAEVSLRFKRLQSEKVHNCTLHPWLCLNQEVCNMDRECSGVNERKIWFGGLPGKGQF